MRKIVGLTVLYCVFRNEQVEVVLKAKSRKPKKCKVEKVTISANISKTLGPKVTIRPNLSNISQIIYTKLTPVATLV